MALISQKEKSPFSGCGPILGADAAAYLAGRLEFVTAELAKAQQQLADIRLTLPPDWNAANLKAVWWLSRSTVDPVINCGFQHYADAVTYRNARVQAGSADAVVCPLFEWPAMLPAPFVGVDTRGVS
jgi:hypothetical protein